MTANEEKILQEWEVLLRNIMDFRVIARENGIKFLVHSNENTGHHRPHFHAATSSAEMVIAIDNGDVIECSGKISPAQKRKATEWWEKNKNIIINNWNQFTNGIEIPIS